MSPDLERRLREAGAALAGPDSTATKRAREVALGAVPSRRRRGGRRTMAIGGLLLGAVAIGVAIGSLTLPGRGAASGPPGLGFLPADGWVVLQSAAPTTSDRPGVAMAANVPLRPQDTADGFPYSTLKALPAHGIVLVASFFRLPSAHGASARLPLQLSNAEPYIRWGGDVRPKRPLGQYELRAVVERYAVDVQAYFGTREPSRALLAEAQRQLDRLIVSPEDGLPTAETPRAPTRRSGVTIAFQRYWYPPGNYYQTRFFGTISSGQANEYVAVMQKQCGAPFATAIAGALTTAGGAWEAVPDRPTGGGEFRARWNDQLSEPVTYRPPLVPWFEKVRPGKFRASVGAYYPPGGKPQSLKGRPIQLQRLAAGRWVLVRTAKLALWKRTPYLYFAATFTVPTKGLKLRAYVPAKTAAPCFGAGASKPVRS